MTDDASASGKRSTQEKEKWGDKAWAQILLIIAGLAIYLLIGLALWWLLDKYIDPQKASQKKDLVQALSLIMAGLGGGVGLYFTWQNTKISRENTKSQLEQARESQEQTQESAQETLKLAEQGQITDRFTQAIEQLGATNDDKSKRLEIRLGGIYALEQIAKHSPEHYSPVMEVLTAYIRENARWIPNKASGPMLTSQQVLNAGTIIGATDDVFTSGVPTDIQAILDVLGRRNQNLIPEEYRMSVNLHQANLSGANLMGADLSGADLVKANLSKALLIGANLSGADLSNADLSGSTLTGANLSNATLGDVHLEGADLQSQGVFNVELQRIALLKRRGVRHELVQFGGGESVSNILVYGANLENSNGLTQEQIEWAVGDDTTKHPTYLARPDDWNAPGYVAPPVYPDTLIDAGTEAEWAEWQKRYTEWEEFTDRRSEALSKQRARIARGLKQKYEDEDGTTKARATPLHNGAEHFDQVDKE